MECSPFGPPDPKFTAKVASPFGFDVGSARRPFLAGPALSRVELEAPFTLVFSCFLYERAGGLKMFS